MRTIKFRGKRLIDGKWIYGVPYLYGCWHIMIDSNTATPEEGTGSWSVDPATVGQFTGLTDKNGKEIYDGDVVEYKGFDNFDKHDAVEWSAITGSWWCGISPLVDVIHDQNVVLPREFKIDGKFEAIGNIHDNNELLKNE